VLIGVVEQLIALILKILLRGTDPDVGVDHSGTSDAHWGEQKTLLGKKRYIDSFFSPFWVN
jgi:hypothetical protein